MFRRHRHRRPPRIAGLSINQMIPNILTLSALCAGLTAIRFGIHGKWEQAVAAILIAAVLDGLDGRVARLLKGTSKFGAELDSLSDFVSFGVAPAMVLYFWTMQSASSLGWPLVLLFTVCCALRLARFNTMIGEPDMPAYAYNFFTGIPAPAAAGIVLLPMAISFQTDSTFFSRPEVVAVFLLGVSFLMVSKVPTFSGKRMRVPHRWVLPLLLLVGLLAAFMVSAPWSTLTGLGVFYLAMIPVSVRSFRHLKAQADHITAGEAVVETPES
jgi:CDP-diacylglycerol---serine O-phosphatidyltransferase